MAIHIRTNRITFDERYQELENLSQEWNCSLYETALWLAIDHYVCAGFYEDLVEKELKAKSKDEMIELYCNGL